MNIKAQYIGRMLIMLLDDRKNRVRRTRVLEFQVHGRIFGEIEVMEIQKPDFGAPRIGEIWPLPGNQRARKNWNRALVPRILRVWRPPNPPPLITIVLGAIFMRKTDW